jgi:hypothetical protein
LRGRHALNGILLLAPLVLIYLYGPRAGAPAITVTRRWQPRYRISGSAAWFALVPVGILAYILYLAAAHNAPLAAYHAEAFWGRSFAGPFGGLWHALTALPDDGRRLLAGTAQPLGPGDPLSWNAHALIDLGFTAFALGGLALSWRRVPFAYFAYALLLLAHALS